MSNTFLLVCALFAAHLAFSYAEDPAKCIVKSGTGKKFSYDVLAPNGPLYWGDLEGNEMCSSGTSQSPIDFPLDVGIEDISKAPELHMKVAKMKMKAKSENWALDCNESYSCGYTTFKGEKYYIVNLHFHTPSEHTLNGKQYPMESHMVHVSEKGELIVIATMFDFKNESTYSAQMYSKKPKDYGKNMFLSVLWKQMFYMDTKEPGHHKEEHAHEHKEKTISVPFGNIINRAAGMCVYNGSLTTPPCSQNVHFLMQLKVQPVSKVQHHKFYQSVNSPMYGINRAVQPLNGRHITCFV